MSKSSVASTPKTPTSQLSSKSAWSKGPPQSASRSQSPAPSNQPPAQATHSRRPSTLGQGIPIKDGVSIPRNVGPTKTSSAVSFGSIDDASAPISSSPAATPAIKAATEGVKSFGSVPATISQVNGKSSVSTSTKPPLSQTSSSTSVSGASTSSSTSASVSTKPKVDVKKFFQTSSTPSTSQSTSDTSSPSIRPSNLPQQHPQPSTSNGPMGAQQYTPFVMRPSPNPPASGVPNTPRSPNYPRQQMPNGNGPRPPNGAAPPGPQMQPPMGSPRLAPHPHPGQQPNVQPPQMQPPPMQMGWNPYYGYMPPPGMPPEQAYMYPPPWQYHGMPPQPMTPHHPQHPPLSQGATHPSMPMSPRNAPPQIQSGPPGTPTPSHASVAPHSPHPPAPLAHVPSGSISAVSSPPPTPSSATHPPGSARLNSSASAFVPRPTSKIIIKSADGSEVVDIENLKKSKSHQSSPSITSPPLSSPSPALNSPSRRAIPIVAPDAAKKKREEKEREEKENQARAAAVEKERKAKEREEEERRKKAKEEEERLRKVKEEAERKEKEEAERKKKEEAERKEKEELERKQRILEAERKAKQEAERKAKEEEEERRRKEAEEEKRRLAEEERLREEKLKLEAEENQRKEEEERRKKEEEARLRRQEEEAAAKAKAEEEAKAQAASAEAQDQEEGEIEEDEKPSSDIQDDKENTRESKHEDKKSLRIDTTGTPEHAPKRRPGPLDLSSVSGKPNIPAPLPSALATARIIDDLGRVPYPEGVKSPKIELNVNAQAGKFRYDREFLLQFMSVCKEKPDNLPALDAIGLDVPNQPFPMTRSQSGRGSRAGSSIRSSSVGLGFAGGSGFKSGTGNSFGGMGNFGTAGSAASKLTSEERYQLANQRTVSMSGAAPFPRPQGIQRTASTGGPGSQLHTGRTRSKRGDKRTDANKAAAGGANHLQPGHGAFGPGGATLEPVVPLPVTENRWDRKLMASGDPDSPEIVDRKVKALLNKLTMEKFDSISDQIIAWANKSEREKDGRTLIQVIRLVFEKATDEATWSEMYARLCRKMMEQISPKVQDDGIKNSEGKPIAGGHLFRKYLLNRCQEDFERGWFNREATAAAAATKALEDEAAKAANESKGEEIALYSDEYYAAQKAKRQGLGLIKFIGELFKLQMLTERIMHECVKKLLGNVENPEEEEIESLCKLLATVGQMLDTPKARAHMNVYFDRMKELTKSQNVSSRMQFMLQDIIELRDRKWQQRNAVAAPTTIAKIHEAAAKEKAAAEKDAYTRQISMSRGGSRRGGDRAEQPSADGWTVSGNAPRPPSKAGDLSKFGQISKGGPMTFGPSSVFAGKKDGKRESLSRTNSSANMFQMLQNVEASEVVGKSSRPPSRKASIDLGSGGAPEPAPQRKRLILQPRTKPIDQDSALPPESDSDSDEEVTEEPEQEMSKAEAKKKIDEDTKEFFGVRNLDEAEVYFAKLPVVHHHALVDKLISTAIESKEADARLVGEFFQRAVSKKLCSFSAFEEGFLGVAEFLDDIAIDAPKATDLFAIMLKGADLSEEQRTAIASKSAENGDKLLDLVAS